MRRLAWSILLFGCTLCLAACSVEKEETKKLRDIEFTVVEAEDVPEELAKQIEENKAKPLKMTYADKGYLYAARGYGAQSTSGYSIAAEKCYETSNAIRIETGLIGPDHAEEVVDKETFPCIVIKMEYSDKNVVFN